MNSKIFVFEAIDGAGKDTLARGILDTLAQGGRRVFDAIEFQKDRGQLPLLDHPDVLKAEFLLVCEPTYVKHKGASYRLRDHLTQGSKTTQREFVRMFAEDRMALYKQLVVPFTEKGGIVIQVRGLASSLAYQPAADAIENPDKSSLVTMSEVLQQPGNRFELEHAPKCIFVLDVDDEIAKSRQAGRDNGDASNFEQAAIQAATRKNYHSAEHRKIFTDQGTKIVDIDASGTKFETLERTFTVFAPYAG